MVRLYRVSALRETETHKNAKNLFENFDLMQQLL